jgi:hypothetical protein
MRWGALLCPESGIAYAEALVDTDLNDPEDSYDATDTVREKLRNFVRRIEWLDEHPDLTIMAVRDRLDRLREDLVTLLNETD